MEKEKGRIEFIKSILEAQLKGVEDDLFRAKMSFRGMNYEEMSKEYGQSGLARFQILASLESRKTKIKNSVDWLEDIKRLLNRFQDLVNE